MGILSNLFSNLFTVPIIIFICGVALPTFVSRQFRMPKIQSILTYILLFYIGLKGGASFGKYSGSFLISILIVMVIWGLIQPVISYSILRRFTRTDAPTSAAIATCFGSVSVMTFAAATAFLEKLKVPYQPLVATVLAIMEVPAIFSGLLLSKWRNDESSKQIKNIWIHSLFNHTILMIFLGIGIGVVCSGLSMDSHVSKLLLGFKPCLCLFLFNMGILIGNQRNELKNFPPSLGLFGLYMPFIGGMFGLIVGYLFKLDPGTGTLIAILSASASYIAAPAAMRIAIPAAKEAVYLPLSLGIAFPINVLIGIPVYYYLAEKLLS